MNNIFLNNDPLLYRSQSQFPYSEPNTPQQMNDMYNNIYKQQIMEQQLNNPQFKDSVGDLDRECSDLDQDVRDALNSNLEYIDLSSELLGFILKEIIGLIKNRLNLNPSVTKNIERQREIIQKCKHSIKTQEKQSMSELNDYMKNYSHLTFDEYKKIKNEKNEK